MAVQKKADTGSSQKRRERRSATSSLAAEGEPVLHKPTPVRRTNGAPPAAPSTPLSVASLFAAASSPRGAPGDARDSLMRALLANPDNRLEHVERAQQQGGTGAAEEDPPDEGRLRAASCQANLSSWEEGLPPVVTPAMLELGPLASPPATSDLPLLTPEAFTRPAADPPPVPALTKDQLRDALIHLLQVGFQRCDVRLLCFLFCAFAKFFRQKPLASSIRKTLLSAVVTKCRSKRVTKTAIFGALYLQRCHRVRPLWYR